jgi:DNA mismatch endonuclease (patch repair protein)
VLGKARVAVFVDGCQWHGCPSHYVRPRTKENFWSDKLLANVNRDRRQTLGLEASRWRVVRLWEHEVFENSESAAAEVLKAMTDPRWRTGQDLRVMHVEPVGTDGTLERRHLQDLRRPHVRRTVSKRRTTAKWRRMSKSALENAASHHSLTSESPRGFFASQKN